MEIGITELGVLGLGFRMYRLERHRVLDIGFKVWGLGLRVYIGFITNPNSIRCFECCF